MGGVWAQAVPLPTCCRVSSIHEECILLHIYCTATQILKLIVLLGPHSHLQGPSDALCSRRVQFRITTFWVCCTLLSFRLKCSFSSPLTLLASVLLKITAQLFGSVSSWWVSGYASSQRGVGRGGEAREEGETACTYTRLHIHRAVTQPWKAVKYSHRGAPETYTEWEKPDTKSNIVSDSIRNTQKRHSIKGRGWEKRRVGSNCLMGMDFSLGWWNVLELGRGSGCTILWVH